MGAAAGHAMAGHAAGTLAGHSTAAAGLLSGQALTNHGATALGGHAVGTLTGGHTAPACHMHGCHTAHGVLASHGNSVCHTAGHGGTGTPSSHHTAGHVGQHSHHSMSDRGAHSHSDMSRDISSVNSTHHGMSAHHGGGAAGPGPGGMRSEDSNKLSEELIKKVIEKLSKKRRRENRAPDVVQPAPLQVTTSYTPVQYFPLGEVQIIPPQHRKPWQQRKSSGYRYSLPVHTSEDCLQQYSEARFRAMVHGR